MRVQYLSINFDVIIIIIIIVMCHSDKPDALWPHSFLKYCAIGSLERSIPLF